MVQVSGIVAAQAGAAVTVILGQRISQALADTFVGLATAIFDAQKISQTALAVFVDPATTSIIAFDPARPYPPSVIFGPDVSHTVVSPSILTVVVAERAEHSVSRKTVDTVLVDSHETEVISPEEFTIHAPETTHRVVFRPPR